MKEQISTIYAAVRAELEWRRANNERMLKDTGRLEGYIDALRYFPQSETTVVPTWLEPIVEDYVEQQRKENDPEYQEYLRLKEKFEE